MTYHNRPRGSNREPTKVHAFGAPRKTACGESIERRECTSHDVDPKGVTCHACRAAVGLPPLVVARTVVVTPDWDRIAAELREHEMPAALRDRRSRPAYVIPANRTRWIAMWPDGELTTNDDAIAAFREINKRSDADAKKAERRGTGAIYLTTIEWRDVPHGFVAPTKEDL